MSTGFNPYYTWLAIPPEEQPPNLYRLLGVTPLEENLDVIETAADRQMKHLRDYQAGKHGDHAQKLLNEISAAKITLLDPAKKAAYDSQLLAKLNLARATELKRARAERPMAAAPSISATPPPEPQMLVPGASASALSFDRVSPARAVRSKSNSLPLVIGASALVLLLLVGGTVIGLSMMSSDPEVAVNISPTNSGPTQGANHDPPATSDDGATSAPVLPPVLRPILPPTIPGETKTPEATDRRPSTAPPDESATNAAPDITDPGEGETTEPAVDFPEVDVSAAHSPGATALPDAAEPAPKKLPIPDTALREAKREQILSLFPLDKARTPQEKGRLIAQLLKTARETENDAAAQFALLNLARETAAEIGDLRQANAAIDMLSNIFDFDDEAVWLASLQQASRATLPAADKRDIVLAGSEMIETLAAAEKFTDADALSERMLTVARAMRDAELIKSLADQRRTLGERWAEYHRVQAANATLKTSPDDPDANLAAGRYLTFVKQDWDAGLPHLSKGSDAALAAAAKAELASPTSTADQEKLADLWWAAAETHKEATVKDECFAQAEYWYGAIIDQLSGLAKLRVEKQLAEGRTFDKKLLSHLWLWETWSRSGKWRSAYEFKFAATGTCAGIPSGGGRASDLNSWQIRDNLLFVNTRNSQKMIVLTYFGREQKFKGADGDATYELKILKRKHDQRGKLLHTNSRTGSAASDVDQDLGIRAIDPGVSEIVYLDDLAEVKSLVGQKSLGKHGDLGWEQSQNVTFMGAKPAHALSMHAVQGNVAFAAYDLEGRFESLAGTAGLWEFGSDMSRASPTPLTFRIVGDGKTLWQSEPLQKHGSGQPFDVNVRGVRSLRLEVLCPGLADLGASVWIEPQLMRSPAQ